MRIRFHAPRVELESDGLTLRVRVRIENASGTLWRAGDGFGLGYQVFDPDTDTLVVDGKRAPLSHEVPPGGRDEFDLEIHLPPQPSRYRVFVSLLQENVCWFYEKGSPFLLIDAAVADRRAAVRRTKVTTRRLLRRETMARSAGRAFAYPLASLWTNRCLIRSMVRRDIAGRYRGSFGGLFWTVLNPLLLMVTYFFVFGVVLRTRFAGDPSRAGFVLYFLAGMLPWLAFSEAAGRAPFIILEYRNFVKKIVFPLETLPVNLVAAGIVTEILAAAIFTVGLLLARGAVPITVFWLPVLLIPQLLFTAGLCWFLAALGVYVRDLGQVIGFLLTLWFFLTPICYPVDSLPAEAMGILSKNPMFVLVRGYREIFLESRAPAFGPMWKLWLLSLVVFFVGHAWFYKLRRHFADVI